MVKTHVGMDEEGRPDPPPGSTGTGGDRGSKRCHIKAKAILELQREGRKGINTNHTTTVC